MKFLPPLFLLVVLCGSVAAMCGDNNCEGLENGLNCVEDCNPPVVILTEQSWFVNGSNFVQVRTYADANQQVTKQVTFLLLPETIQYNVTSEEIRTGVQNYEVKLHDCSENTQITVVVSDGNYTISKQIQTENSPDSDTDTPGVTYSALDCGLKVPNRVYLAGSRSIVVAQNTGNDDLNIQMTVSALDGPRFLNLAENTALISAASTFDVVLLSINESATGDYVLLLDGGENCKATVFVTYESKMGQVADISQMVVTKVWQFLKSVPGKSAGSFVLFGTRIRFYVPLLIFAGIVIGVYLAYKLRR